MSQVLFTTIGSLGDLHPLIAVGRKLRERGHHSLLAIPDSRSLSVSMNKKSVVIVDPEIMSGTPVFVGTRVPVRTLLDHIEAGDSLDVFLEDFLSVSFFHESTIPFPPLSCSPRVSFNLSQLVHSE